MSADSQLAKEMYNQYFDQYEQQKAAYHPMHDFRNQIYAYMGDLKNKSILFAACGDGKECIPAIEQGAQVTGIDVSDKAIEHCKKNMPSGCFEVMDFTKTSFADSSFDFIMAVHAIVYAPDLNILFAEWNRILKKDGAILLGLPHPVRKMMKYNNQKYFVKGKQFETWGKVQRFNYYRLFEDYIDSFVQSNLKIVKLVEPKPVKDPMNPLESETDYPHFLIIKLVKDN